MNKINLRNIDLNLLLVFDVLMRERSVTRTAHKLGRTQSAISHALNRLRTQLGDPLLVKAAGGMQASPFALEMAEEVRLILQQIERVLTPNPVFDPALSSRNFRIALPDFMQHLFPYVVATANAQAPNIQLEWTRVSDHMLSDLVHGSLDACIGPSYLKQPDGITSLPLNALDWGCFMHHQHPALQLPWSLNVWKSYPHVVVKLGLSDQSPVNRALSQHSATRRVGAFVPHFSTVAPLLMQTHMIATLPTIAIAPVMHLYGLNHLPIPFTLEPMGQMLFWSSRLHNDSANQWLRALLTQGFNMLTTNPYGMNAML